MSLKSLLGLAQAISGAGGIQGFRHIFENAGTTCNNRVVYATDFT